MTKKRMFAVDMRCKITANIEGASTQASTPTVDNPVPVLPLQIDTVSGLNVSSLNLHGIGSSYKDIYDYSTRIITRKISKKILTGAEAWSISEWTHTTYIPFFWPTFYDYLSTDNTTLSNYFKFVEYNEEPSCEGMTRSGDNFILWVAKARFTHTEESTEEKALLLQEFKDWIASLTTPIEIYNIKANTTVEKSSILTRFSIGENRPYYVPDDYTELVSLKSDTNCCIMTDYIPALTDTIEVKAIKSKIYSLFGSGGDGFTFTGNSSYNFVYMGYESTKLEVQCDDQAAANIWAIKDKRAWCNSYYSDQSTATTSPTLPLALFSRSTSTTTFDDGGDHTIYYVKIWKYDVLRRYMVPVKRNSDSVLGFYDIITKSFFTNIGTGILVAGEEATTQTSISKTFIPETES